MGQEKKAVVQIAINGQQFSSSSAIMYSYFTPPVLSSDAASPVFGPIRGGTNLTIIGSNFPLSEHSRLIRAQFGSIERSLEPCMYANSGKVYCNTPVAGLGTGSTEILFVQ